MSFNSFRTHYFDHVYILSSGTVCGVEEGNGPLKGYFDCVNKDYRNHQESFEKAERENLKQSLQICLDKCGLKKEDVSFYIGADLLNQNTTIHYLMRNIPSIPITIYGACSSFCLSIGLSALLLEGGYATNIMSLISSHHLTAERQYRYPIEYGIQRKVTTTFTATGGVSTLLTTSQSEVRVSCVTFGEVVDYNQNDPNDMGRVMAPAAYHTLKEHFKNTNTTFKDYDFVLTGDLSKYGKTILTQMFENDGMKVENYNDCGCLLYDEKQDVYQGGSGCACSALVTMGYLYSLLKNRSLKKVLIVATGALLSPMMSAQKESIPSIAHAICLEAVS